MKKISLFLLAAILLNSISIVSFAQNVKNDLSLALGYYNSNNQVHYLVVHAKSKIDGKFQMIPNVSVTFYISAELPANVLGKAVTNEKGEALVLIPPSAKNEWNKSAKQSFIAVSQTSKLFDEAKKRKVLTIGIGAVLYWYWTESNGHGDLRAYILVQFLPMLLLPTILLLFPGQYLKGRALAAAMAFYLVAKLFEQFDGPVFQALGILSGHSLKHLVSAIAVFCIVIAVPVRQRGAGVRAVTSRTH